MNKLKNIVVKYVDNSRKLGEEADATDLSEENI